MIGRMDVQKQCTGAAHLLLALMCAAACGNVEAREHRSSLVLYSTPSGGSLTRLRGGSPSAGLGYFENCAVDPTRIAGVGIGCKLDKLGNHVVVALKKGWPAALSGDVMEGDIVIEVDDMPTAPLSTMELLQRLRGPEASQVKLLLQRRDSADLVEVCLERVLQGIVDPSDTPKKGYLESTIDMGLSMGDKATSLFKFASTAKSTPSQDKSPADDGGEVGVGIGFTCDEDANFVVSKLVSGGPGALCKQIKAGDVLVAVDGMEVGDMTMKDLVKLLKGPVGTSTQLDLRRGRQTFSVALTRAHAGASKSSASGGSSIAAGIFNSMSGIAASSIPSLPSLSTLSATAGGATAALSGTLSSVTASLTSFSFSSKAAPQPSCAGEMVGIGLGIKKNQHGDFMIMDIAANQVRYIYLSMYIYIAMCVYIAMYIYKYRC